MRRVYVIFSFFIFAGAAWTYANSHGHDVPGICIFKSVTSMPCPACGSTRAVLLLLQGDMVGSLAMNPLGMLTTLAMLIGLVFAVCDMMFQTRQFPLLWEKFDSVLRQRAVYIPLTTLILLNWTWNIAKGL